MVERNHILTRPSHAPKTGQIKKFVILEESSIAKGIRRIMGVTGSEAGRAQKEAQAFEHRINALKNLSPSELEAALKVVALVMLN